MRTESAASTPAASTTAATPVTTAVLAGYSGTRTLDLIVTTREGDTVTISSSQTETAGCAVAGSEATAAGAFVRSTSSSLSVSIDGDLNKDELADLQKVLKALGQAGRREHARGLHRGHHHGHHRGQDLNTLATISGSVNSSFAVIGGTLVSTDKPASSASAATVDQPASAPSAAPTA